MKASEFANFFDFDIELNTENEVDPHTGEVSKYIVVDQQHVFHTRYIDDVKALIDCFDSMLDDYIVSEVEDDGFEFDENSNLALFEQIYDWAQDDTFWCQHNVIRCLAGIESIENDIDFSPDPTLTIYENLSFCKESLLFSSGTQIATYGTPDNYVSLEVNGSVHVVYKDEHYYDVIEMPQELKDILAGDYWDNEEVYVDLNNWFAYVHVVDGEAQYNDLVCESDLSEFTRQDLKNDMAEALEWFNEPHKIKFEENDTPNNFPLVFNRHVQVGFGEDMAFDQKLVFAKSYYMNGDGLAIMAFSLDEDNNLDPYDIFTITVNLPGSFNQHDGYTAYIDVNNNKNIDAWLEDNGIAAPSGVESISGFVTYPMFDFNKEWVDSLPDINAINYEILQKQIDKFLQADSRDQKDEIKLPVIINIETKEVIIPRNDFIENKLFLVSYDLSNKDLGELAEHSFSSIEDFINYMEYESYEPPLIESDSSKIISDYIENLLKSDWRWYTDGIDAVNEIKDGYSSQNIHDQDWVVDVWAYRYQDDPDYSEIFHSLPEAVERACEIVGDEPFEIDIRNYDDSRDCITYRQDEGFRYIGNNASVEFNSFVDYANNRTFKEVPFPVVQVNTVTIADALENAGIKSNWENVSSMIPHVQAGIGYWLEQELPGAMKELIDVAKEAGELNLGNIGNEASGKFEETFVVHNIDVER